MEVKEAFGKSGRKTVGSQRSCGDIREAMEMSEKAVEKSQKVWLSRLWFRCQMREVVVMRLQKQWGVREAFVKSCKQLRS